MRPNRLRDIWNEGGVALNGWIHSTDTLSAEIMAHAGWDSLVIDLQHGFATMETVLSLLQAISTTDTVPLVRLSWNDALQTQRVLDAGAAGVICPVINNAAECEQFVAACRYPPRGFRSFGPTRARIYGGADYAENAAETVVTFAMIETAEGYDNMDEIIAVDGLDGIFVGPSDLGLTKFGRFGMPMRDPELWSAIGTIAERTRAAGKVAGVWTPNVEMALAVRELGFQLINVGIDLRHMKSAVEQAVQHMRAATD